MRVFTHFSMPPAQAVSWEERWGDDKSALLSCWFRGIEKAQEDPDLAARARADELPVLAWRGGVERLIKDRNKVGSMYYLAMWQGLRSQCLDVDLDQPVRLVCSRTGVPVTFMRNDLMLVELAARAEELQNES